MFLVYIYRRVYQKVIHIFSGVHYRKIQVGKNSTIFGGEKLYKNKCVEAKMIIHLKDDELFENKKH